MTEEPTIVINGKRLTVGQSMTVRNALESFAFRLSCEGLGEDEHGARMTAGYLSQIDEIRDIIFYTVDD